MATMRTGGREGESEEERAVLRLLVRRVKIPRASMGNSRVYLKGGREGGMGGWR